MTVNALDGLEFDTEEKELIENAASLLGVSVSDFIKDVTLQRAVELVHVEFEVDDWGSASGFEREVKRVAELSKACAERAGTEFAKGFLYNEPPGSIFRLGWELAREFYDFMKSEDPSDEWGIQWIAKHYPSIMENLDAGSRRAFIRGVLRLREDFRGR